MADRGVRQRRPKLGEPGISFLLGRLLLVHRQRHGALRRDLEPERLELLHPAQLILDGDVGRAKRLVRVPQNAAMLTHLAPQFRAILPATALALMALEFGFARFAGRATHDLRESAASLGVAAGQLALRAVEVGVVAAPAAFVYAHRLFHFEETSWLALLCLFVGGEFLYYWQHRAAHRVRWFWASHSVHHSATRLNLTAAIRLGWTAKISGMFLFFLPLALIGYSPLLLTAMLGFNLAYQFFIHTELAPRLGVLEWVLNTPTHHRVHHAANQACLDRNFGGVLIVFDRLFGTFAAAPDGEPLRYGLIGESRTNNPVRIALGGWAQLLSDLRNSGNPNRAFSVLLGPPGALKTSKETS